MGDHGHHRGGVVGLNQDSLSARVCGPSMNSNQVPNSTLASSLISACARLDRLTERGILAGWAPTLDPAALGYPVTAFLTLQLRQGIGHDVVAAHLEGIAEVTEAHTITGEGDMWCRVVARSNADLQRVIDAVLAHEGIVRSTTVIALDTQIRPRVLPLVR